MPDTQAVPQTRCPPGAGRTSHHPGPWPLSALYPSLSSCFACQPHLLPTLLISRPLPQLECSLTSFRSLCKCYLLRSQPVTPYRFILLSFPQGAAQSSTRRSRTNITVVKGFSGPLELPTCGCLNLSASVSSAVQWE